MQYFQLYPPHVEAVPACTIITYEVPDARSVNVCDVPVVVVAHPLPRLTRYLVAPDTASHENTMLLDVTEHAKPVGAATNVVQFTPAQCCATPSTLE